MNAIHKEGNRAETKPIDSPISFFRSTRTGSLCSHYDTLVLTLFINGFDVHNVLVDPGSAVDLLQLPTFKQYLIEPPILVSPNVGDTLYLYLAVSEVLVSEALFKKDENHKQIRIFFISKYLSEAKTRYTRLKQAALALRVAAKKL